MDELNWIPVIGRFELTGGVIKFLGKPDQSEPSPNAVGLCVCNRTFSGGRITTKLRLNQRGTAEILFFYSPASNERLTAGIGAGGKGLFGIRSYNAEGWEALTYGGSSRNLILNEDYDLELTLLGSSATLRINGVEVGSTVLPWQPRPSQVGVYCSGNLQVEFRDFKVESRVPTVFVAMHYTAEFSELFEEVIKPVCSRFGLAAVRSDETAGPGVVMSDLTRQIAGARVVIAEITPQNPNVYYEVGYAHALNKPTILIADKAQARLPFDVSSFRTLFYENTIAGKKKIDKGLDDYLKAIIGV